MGNNPNPRGARAKSSMKQEAYARRVWGAQGETKKEIALALGYSPNVANSVKSHIEEKPGFKYAMMELAYQSNNIALKVLNEFNKRDLGEYSNKDLTGALNAIAQAWDKFNSIPKGKEEAGGNKLRTLILQQVENQTVNAPVESANAPLEDF